MQICPLNQPLFHLSVPLFLLLHPPPVALIREGQLSPEFSLFDHHQQDPLQWHTARHRAYSVTWQNLDTRSMWLSCVVLTASGADLINVWCEPGSFLTSTAEVLWLKRLERTTPSGWKGGCWISSWTIEPAARQAEGGNKAPYCPPPLPFEDGTRSEEHTSEDGTNWLYKRHQRKVPLRVSVTIDSLGGRPENRKVTSVITAGVHALIRPNGVVLITRKTLRWQLLLFTQGSCASWVYQL